MSDSNGSNGWRADLEERRAEARLGGGEARIARQHDKGKLTARERLDVLLDDGSFEEIGMFVRHQCDVRDLTIPDSSVDVVFMNGMFGNIVDKEAAMTNLVRMLGARGRVVISHPEGRAFVAQIVRSEPFPITPLPSEGEAHSFLGSFGLTVQQYVDEEKLLIVVATKDASLQKRGNAAGT